MTYYLPIPPRAWSRVDLSCASATPTQEQYKGNILQYKNNSANLTKSQKYSLISKGMWLAKKSYATQTQTYTNPNTCALQRVNYVEYEYPNNIVGAPNNPAGPFQFAVPSPYGCNTVTIKDKGTLICGTLQNQCTDELISTASNQSCFPTYCSDVPGPPILLCWSPRMATWYPRVNRTMNNSTDKFPYNYKGFQSAIHISPPILTYTLTDNVITLSWAQSFSKCIPIQYNIVYENEIILGVYPTPTNSTEITLQTGKLYTFYVIAGNNNLTSGKSNVVTIYL